MREPWQRGTYRPNAGAVGRRISQLTARIAVLEEFARWLISLDDPARLDERQAITLPDIISRARTALGEETDRDR